jgi:hypothetical protein
MPISSWGIAIFTPKMVPACVKERNLFCMTMEIHIAVSEFLCSFHTSSTFLGWVTSWEVLVMNPILLPIKKKKNYLLSSSKVHTSLNFQKEKEKKEAVCSCMCSAGI